MADQSYDEMYKQLKQEAEDVMNSKTVDSCVDDFKSAVEKRVEAIKQDIDLAITDALDLGLQVFDKIGTEGFNDVELPDFDKLVTFDLKVKRLQEFMNQLIKKNNSTLKIFESLSSTTDNELELFRKNKEEKLELKIYSRLKVLTSGKISTDLNWKKVQNQPSWSSLDPNDERVLKVMGRGCYNYYLTDKEFETSKDENVYAEFEINVKQSDNYLYFGVVNESAIPSSNCMCCTISQGCYIYQEGKICIHGTTQDNSKLEYKSKGIVGNESILRVRLMLSEKQVYYQVDEKDEQGPFALQGSKFRITFGSCNTADGYIKLLESYYI